MKTIRAAVVHEKSGRFTIEEIQLEEPRDNEILVEIVATGVCHTDIAVRDQSYPVPLPAVLGHEGAGVVAKVGRNILKVKPGDHVIVTYDFCGKCENCAQGQPGFCEEFYGRNLSGARLDGTSPISLPNKPLSGCFFCQSSFANEVITSENNVVKIPKDIPLELMGPLGCGIQTGAGAVINSLAPKAGSSIAIFGAGAVGLSAVMAAKIVGCTKIITVDLNEDRLKLALELGSTHVINGGDADAVKEIRELTNGGANYSLECTSVPSVFRQAVESLRVPGTCGLIGAAPLGVDVQLEMASILFGRTVQGIMQGDCVPDVFVPKLIELWRAGKFPFDRLTKFYPLEDINDAIKAAESGAVVKPIIVMS